MSYITKQEQIQSGWRTWISTEGFNTFIIETTHQLSEGEAETIHIAYLDQHQYDSVLQSFISIYENREPIINTIAFIKLNNPNITQWNAYLSSQTWNDALMIRWFLATLALKLANRKEINLTDYTETQVLNTLKIFIIDTPARKLNKIIFGE